MYGIRSLRDLLIKGSVALTVLVVVVLNIPFLNLTLVALGLAWLVFWLRGRMV